MHGELVLRDVGIEGLGRGLYLESEGEHLFVKVLVDLQGHRHGRLARLGYFIGTVHCEEVRRPIDDGHVTRQDFGHVIFLLHVEMEHSRLNRTTCRQAAPGCEGDFAPSVGIIRGGYREALLIQKIISTVGVAHTAVVHRCFFIQVGDVAEAHRHRLVGRDGQEGSRHEETLLAVADVGHIAR